MAGTVGPLTALHVEKRERIAPFFRRRESAERRRYELAATLGAMHAAGSDDAELDAMWDKVRWSDQAVTERQWEKDCGSRREAYADTLQKGDRRRFRRLTREAVTFRYLERKQREGVVIVHLYDRKTKAHTSYSYRTDTGEAVETS